MNNYCSYKLKSCYKYIITKSVSNIFGYKMSLEPSSVYILIIISKV